MLGEPGWGGVGGRRGRGERPLSEGLRDAILLGHGGLGMVKTPAQGDPATLRTNPDLGPSSWPTDSWAL